MSWNNTAYSIVIYTPRLCGGKEKYIYSVGNINNMVLLLVYPPKAENFFGLNNPPPR